MKSLVFYIALELWLIILEADVIFVSPTIGCSTSCIGDNTQPFDNLWAALSYIPVSDPLDIRLLKGTHYLFYQEISPTTTTVRYNLPTTINQKFNISIRPLFCTDSEAPLFSVSDCTNLPQTVQIFSKSENFELIVQGESLNISYLQFSWREDISKYNTMSVNLGYCVFRRINCCQVGIINAITDPTLFCSSTSNTRSINRNIFLTTSQAITRSLTIQNCEFYNIDFRSSVSLFGFDTLTILNFENVVFRDFDVTSIISSFQTPTWQDARLSFTNLSVYQNTESDWFNKLPIVFIEIPTNIIQPLAFTYSKFSNFTIPEVASPIFQTLNNASYIITMEYITFYNVSIPNYAVPLTSIIMISNNSELKIINGQLTMCSFGTYTSFLAASNSSTITLKNFEIEHYQLTTNNMEFIYFDSGSSFSGENLNFEHLKMVDCRCYLINAEQFFRLQIQNSEISNSELADLSNFILASQGFGNIQISNLKMKNLDITSVDTNQIISLETSALVNLTNIEISYSNYSGEATLFEIFGTPATSSLVISGFIFQYNSIIEQESSHTKFIVIQDFGMTNIESITIYNNTIYNKEYFLYFDSSNLINIQNVNIEKNEYFVRSQLNHINNYLFSFQNCEIQLLGNLSIIGNIFNALADTYFPFQNDHHYSLIELFKSTGTNIQNIECLFNVILGYFKAYFNIEFIEARSGTYSFNNISITETNFQQASFFYFAMATVTINSLTFSNCQIDGMLVVIDDYSHCTASGFTIYENTLSTIILMRNSEGSLSNSYFHNNYYGEYIFVGDSQDKGYGVCGASQDSHFNFSNSIVANENITDEFSLFMTEKSHATYSNIEFINISINSPGLILRSANFPTINFYNNIFTNVTKNNHLPDYYDNQYINPFRAFYRYMVYLFQATGQAHNQTFINSDVLWISSQSNYELSSFTIKNRNYPNWITQMFYNYKGTLTIENVEISNLESENKEADNLIGSYSGQTTIINFQVKNVIASTGNLIFSQFGSVSITEMNLINIQFTGWSIFDISSLTSFSMKNSYFKNTRNLLRCDQISKLTLNNINFNSNFQNIDYVIRIQNSKQVSLNGVIVSLTESNNAISIIEFKQSQNIEILSCRISNTNSEYGAVHIVQSEQSMSVSIQSSTFSNNIANGEGSGAIYLDQIQGGSFTCSGSTFINNQALVFLSNGGRGGAVSIYSIISKSSNPTFTFSGCTFQNNFASLHGGAIYVYGIAPNMISCTMVGNTPNNMGSQAIGLMSLQDLESGPGGTLQPEYSIESERTVKFWYATMSQPLNQSYEIHLIDRYRGTAYDNSECILNILNGTGPLSASVNLFQAINGVFSFKDIELYAHSGSIASVGLQVAGLQDFVNVEGMQNVDSNFTLQVSFRSCTTGERYDPTNGTCLPCPYGLTQLSDAPNYEGDCVPCDQTMVCYGGSNIGPAAGYWMMNVSADLIFACPQPSACFGGTFPTSCAEGYEGNLCNQCVPGYGKRSGGLACFKCSEYASLYAQMGLKFMFLILCLFLYFRSSMDEFEGKEIITSQRIGVFRVLISYLQIRSLIGAVVIRWPGSVVTLTSLMGLIGNANEDYFGFDCFFSLSLNTERHYYREVITYTFLPVIVFVGSTILVCLFHRVKWVQVTELNRRLAATIGFFIFMFYPSVSKNILGLFSCINLYRSDHVDYYLQNHYDIKCWTSSHMIIAFGFGIPLIIIWILGLPLLIFLGVRYFEPSKYLTNSVLSIFMRGYRRERITWEVLNLVLKIGVIGIVAFGGIYSSDYQIFMLTYFFFIWARVNKSFKPSISDIVTEMESFAISSLGMVSLCGIFFEIVEDFTLQSSLFIFIVYIVDAQFLISILLFYLKREEWFTTIVKKRFQVQSPMIYDCLSGAESEEEKSTRSLTDKLMKIVHKL